MIDELAIDSLDILGSDYYNLVGFKGLGTASSRADRPTRARRHGAIDITTYYDPRTFEIDLWVLGLDGSDWTGFWTALDALKGALALGSTHQVLSWRRQGKTYGEYSVVSVEGDIDPRFPSSAVPACEVNLTLIAADPRMYGEIVGYHSFASTQAVINGGNFNTFPSITFNGAGTDPGLRNNTLTTENEINIDYTMIGGDIIIVDCLARTVKLNGTLRPDLLVPSTSHFWGLASGTNNVEKLGGAVTVEISWNDANI